MVRELLLLQNQSGCLKSVRLPRLHAAEEAGARGGQTLVCGIHSGGRGRGRAGGTASALQAGSGKNVQDRQSKGHLAYWLPGPGRVARCPHRLPPVRKTTLGKPKDKRELPQHLTLQLCSVNNPCFHPSEGIPAPLVHGGFRH